MIEAKIKIDDLNLYLFDDNILDKD